MALNARKAWGSYANKCRACGKSYGATRPNVVYCSAECGREGRLRH